MIGGRQNAAVGWNNGGGFRGCRVYLGDTYDPFETDYVRAVKYLKTLPAIAPLAASALVSWIFCLMVTAMLVLGFWGRLRRRCPLQRGSYPLRRRTARRSPASRWPP